MVKKSFILNVDNFGLSNEYNQAVLEGYINGFLTSASICTNGEAYENAIHDILPDCPKLGVGIHLNITTGKSITECPLLTDNGIFNKNFLYFYFNRKNEAILNQIANEFRAQIEKLKSDTNIDHISSNGCIHAIPEIFNIVCVLAKEFDIPFVRTHFEELYFVPRLVKHLNLKYPRNLVKLLTLQNLTKENRTSIDKYGLKTNDFLIGLNYEGMMSSETIELGLQVLDEDCIVEAVIHPKKYNNSTKDNHTREFGITQNLTLKDTISRLGFDITNYKNIK
ncbi:ChbG/HpnK family deacetylase [bacterium]|nr:ChbG/HpnK family deacetylase [bacterium]